MAKATTPTHARAYDDLRKEARKLESDLEVKLAAYSKMANRLDHLGQGEAGLAADQLASSKESSIEGALRRLSDVNDSMGGEIGGGADPRAHTLARHRDILNDLTQEFRRLRSSYGAARERADLLAGAQSDSFTAAQASTGLLLRERTGIQNSNAALDDVIGQAQAVSSSLGEQRGLFDNIGTKLAGVSGKFPVVNGVLNSIRRKKNKDSLILAAVITVCTLFLLIYWMRK